MTQLIIFVAAMGMTGAISFHITIRRIGQNTDMSDTIPLYACFIAMLITAYVVWRSANSLFETNSGANWVCVLLAVCVPAYLTLLAKKISEEAEKEQKNP